MAVNIVLTIAGQGSGSGGESREFVYSVVDPTAPLVTLSLSDTTGVTSYLWEILNQPIGASAVLSSDSVASPTFTPTNSIWGTYLIRCTITRSSVQEIGTVALSFKTPIRDMRFPAAGEKVEFSATNGWMVAEQVLYEIVDGISATSYWDRTGTILSPDTAGDTLQLSDGTAAIPSSAYVSDPDTGKYLHATGIEGFSSAGVAQILFGNDGSPYIKAADNHQYLTIGNYKTTAGTASQVLVEAAGAAANPGGILDLKATAPSSKSSELNVLTESVAGPAEISVISNSGTSASSNSTALLQAIGQGPATTTIRADTSVNAALSTISIFSESVLGNASIHIGSTAPAGTGAINLGTITTDSVRLTDKNLNDSSITWSYLEISKALGEWDLLDTNFGNASLVAILNTLYAAIGGTPALTHNSLLSIDGGNGTDEFYHFTDTDHGIYTDNTPFIPNSVLFVDSTGSLAEDNDNFTWDEADQCLKIYSVSDPSLFGNPISSTNVALRVENLNSDNDASEVLKIYSASDASTGYAIRFQGDQGDVDGVSAPVAWGHRLWTDGSITMGREEDTYTRSFVSTRRYATNPESHQSRAILRAENAALDAYAEVYTGSRDTSGGAGTSYAGELRLNCSDTIKVLSVGSTISFSDGYRSASDWTTSEMPFASSSAEWSAIRALLGDTEGSVLAAIAASSGVSGLTEHYVCFGASDGTIDENANLQYDSGLISKSTLHATYGSAPTSASFATATVTVDWSGSNKPYQAVSVGANVTSLSMTAPDGCDNGMILDITATGAARTISGITNVSWAAGSDLSGTGVSIPSGDWLCIHLYYNGTIYKGWVSQKAV